MDFVHASHTHFNTEMVWKIERNENVRRNTKESETEHPVSQLKGNETPAS